MALWHIGAEEFFFTGEVGGADPLNRSFSIWNDYGVDLNWSAAISLGAWASVVAPASGVIAPGSSASVEIAVSLTGLSAGDLFALLTITTDAPVVPNRLMGINLSLADPVVFPAQPTLTSLTRTGATGVAVVGGVPVGATTIVWGRPFFNSNLKVEIGRKVNPGPTTNHAVPLDFSDFVLSFFGWFTIDLPCLVEAMVKEGDVYSLPTDKALPILFGSGGGLAVAGARDPADNTKINMTVSGVGTTDQVIAMKIDGTPAIEANVHVGNGLFILSGVNPNWRYQIDFFQLTPEGSIIAIVPWAEESLPASFSIIPRRAPEIVRK